jgi:hypothetical protein
MKEDNPICDKCNAGNEYITYMEDYKEYRSTLSDNDEVMSFDQYLARRGLKPVQSSTVEPDQIEVFEPVIDDDGHSVECDTRIGGICTCQK